MKAKELIEKLQTIVDFHGDLPIYFVSDGDGRWNYSQFGDVTYENDTNITVERERIELQ